MNCSSKLLWKNRILFFLVIYGLIIFCNCQTITTECHYSCITCLDDQYNKCVTCKNGYTFTKLMDKYRQSKGKVVQIKNGICMNQIQMQFNILGICAIFGFVAIFGAKNHQKKNQSIFTAIWLFQTLSMLSFLPIPFMEPLSYLFQSFTPFMFLVMIEKTYKLFDISQHLIENDFYRLEHFLKSDRLYSNFYILGPIIIILLVYVICIPIFLHFRKHICGQDTCRKCSQKTLRKIEQIFYIFYFFIIQESYLVIFTALKYDAAVSNIIIGVIFVFSNIFMCINYGLKPIKYFPNQRIQFVCIIEKFLLPLMIVFEPLGYLISVPILIMVSLILKITLNNKNYALQQFQKKKYLSYLGLATVMIIFTGILVVMEKSIKSQTGVRILTYFVSALIISLYVVVCSCELIELFYGYYMQKKKEQQMRNILIRQMSTKMNFTTQQILNTNPNVDNISEEINFSSQKKLINYKRKNNVSKQNQRKKAEDKQIKLLKQFQDKNELSAKQENQSQLQHQKVYIESQQKEKHTIQKEKSQEIQDQFDSIEINMIKLNPITKIISQKPQFQNQRRMKQKVEDTQALQLVNQKKGKQYQLKQISQENSQHKQQLCNEFPISKSRKRKHKKSPIKQRNSKAKDGKDNLYQEIQQYPSKIIQKQVQVQQPTIITGKKQSLIVQVSSQMINAQQEYIIEPQEKDQKQCQKLSEEKNHQDFKQEQNVIAINQLSIQIIDDKCQDYKNQQERIDKMINNKALH